MMHRVLQTVALLAAMVPMTTPLAAGELKYHLRAVRGGPGVKVNSAKQVTITPRKGDTTLTLEIYALLPNGNNNHADDGIQSGQLSFQTLPVEDKENLKGFMDAASGAPNVTLEKAFQVGMSSTGLARDIDGDGDVDIGSANPLESGRPSPFYTFAAGTDPKVGAYVYGKGVARKGAKEAKGTLVKIGTLTVRFHNPAAGQTTAIHVEPRTRQIGGHYWREDGKPAGNGYTDKSNGCSVSSGSDVIVAVPGGVAKDPSKREKAQNKDDTKEDGAGEKEP